MKGFVDNKLDAVKMMIALFGTVVNVDTGETLVTYIFTLSHSVSEAFFQLLEPVLCGKWVKNSLLGEITI